MIQWSMYCSECLAYINVFNPYTDPMTYDGGTIINTIFRWINGDREVN